MKKLFADSEAAFPLLPSFTFHFKNYVRNFDTAELSASRART